MIQLQMTLCRLETPDSLKEVIDNTPLPVAVVDGNAQKIGQLVKWQVERDKDGLYLTAIIDLQDNALAETPMPVFVEGERPQLKSVVVTRTDLLIAHLHRLQERVKRLEDEQAHRREMELNP